MPGRAVSGRFASTSAPCRPRPSFQSLHAQLPRLCRGYKCPKATPESKESLAGDENGMSPGSLKLHGPICAGTELCRIFTAGMEAHLKNSGTCADFEPELPGQLELPEGWDSPTEEKTAVQKFLYPDEDELTSDFAVSALLAALSQSCLDAYDNFTRTHLLLDA